MNQTLKIDRKDVEENMLITQVARLLEPIGEVNSATQPIVINFTIYENSWLIDENCCVFNLHLCYFYKFYWVIHDFLNKANKYI